jgi:hypothetical protein
MQAQGDEGKKHVYRVTYTHTFHDGAEDLFHIGIYSTKAAAEGAVAQLIGQPGFKDDLDGFSIDEEALDETSWREGFITEYGR